MSTDRHLGLILFSAAVLFPSTLILGMTMGPYLAFLPAALLGYLVGRMVGGPVPLRLVLRTLGRLGVVILAFAALWSLTWIAGPARDAYVHLLQLPGAFMPVFAMALVAWATISTDGQHRLADYVAPVEHEHPSHVTSH